ncbi:SDR family NAD(P)-dependent oxidoreductase [Burkholderia territorii]|uniref:SDR family NAD(P)-dependent oxidoreductase n=1 Tax=Burkholderia territorii TaxID=1503055 RepID=UPI000752C39E|nr:SDR family oxidoreductase [Burkholderia territorii]KVQ62995.1 short-chain dehydrogenase [Burkholderia territorii]
MNRFGNRAAVVTGGGSGIGEAVVRGLFAEGASVVVVDANEGGATRVANSLGDPQRAYAVGLDVTDRTRVDQVMSEAAERFGKIDILVNCAGIRGVGSVMEVDPEQWRRVHAVNLEGSLYPSQAFARLVVKNGNPGAIVNTSSMAGIMGIPNRASYVSSKHAIVGMTREMAMEAGPLGIRVNAVAPGMIRTPMTEVMFQDPDGEQRIRAVHPVGRAGRAEEVAAAILFLASDDASFITGAILPVDGGYAAGKGW